MTLQDLIRSNEFRALPDEEKLNGLRETIPGFGDLPAEEQAKALADFQPGGPDPIGGALGPPAENGQFQGQGGTFGRKPTKEASGEWDEKPSGIGHLASVGARGVYKGVALGLGGIADAGNRIAGELVRKPVLLGGSPGPASLTEKPIGGSDWIMENVFDPFQPGAIGRPQNGWEEILQAGGEATGAALLPTAGVARYARAITPAGKTTGVIGQMAAAASENPSRFARMELLAAGTSGATGETSRAAAEGLGAGPTGQTIAKVAGSLVGAAPYGLASKNVEWEPEVDRRIFKAIRPGVEGKRSAGQIEKFKNRARDAVETIIENKPNLSLTDESGQVVKGELPKNLMQFSEAVDQTKGEIFKAYDTLAKQAGQAGAAVDLDPIVQELRSIAAQRPLQAHAPSTASHAEALADQLAKIQQYGASEAQDAIRILNKKLEAFYKNPGYDTASNAFVDAMVANRLRRGLDDTIEKAAGDGYQELKNTYGSLKAIERDVNRRAVVDARKNAKGLLDFSDIFSAGEVVSGILSMNPAQIARGSFAKLVASTYRHLNDPNTVVRKMFSGAEDAMSAPTKSFPGIGTVAGLASGGPEERETVGQSPRLGRQIYYSATGAPRTGYTNLIGQPGYYP